MINGFLNPWLSLIVASRDSQRHPARGAVSLWLTCYLCWAFGCVPLHAQVFGAEQDIVSIYLFNGDEESEYKARLERRMQLRLDSLAKVLDLDDDQSEKLQWAMRGDLIRFYHGIDCVRQQTRGLDFQNQADMQKAFVFILPLQQRVNNGLLQEGSLFQKVLDTSLSPEQHELQQQNLRQRQAARHQAIMRMTIAEIDRCIPLLARQRDELLAAMTAIEPPRKVPQGYDAFLGYIVTLKLDESVLSKILDKAQCKAFLELRRNYAAYEQGITW